MITIASSGVLSSARKRDRRPFERRTRAVGNGAAQYLMRNPGKILWYRFVTVITVADHEFGLRSASPAFQPMFASETGVRPEEFRNSRAPNDRRKNGCDQGEWQSTTSYCFCLSRRAKFRRAATIESGLRVRTSGSLWIVCPAAASSSLNLPVKHKANSNLIDGARWRFSTQVRIARSIPPNKLPLWTWRTEIGRGDAGSPSARVVTLFGSSDVASGCAATSSIVSGTQSSFSQIQSERSPVSVSGRLPSVNITLDGGIRLYIDPCPGSTKND